MRIVLAALAALAFAGCYGDYDDGRYHRGGYYGQYHHRGYAYRHYDRRYW